MDTPEELHGVVERVVYHDTNSRYTVLRVLAPGYDTLITAVGRLTGVDQGADVVFRGRWDEHPTHGRQFAVTGVKVEIPKTRAGIERRLMRYPGVKAVMASRIVARFGDDTLEILDQQPRRLLEVEGFGPKTLERVLEHHRTHTGPIAQIEAQLLELDLPPFHAEAIHARYGDDGVNVLRKHPYRLAKDVRGIGFSTADRIAQSLGIERASPERIEAGLVHVLEQAEGDGHCALPIEELVTNAVRALGVDPEAVREAGERLAAAGDVVLEYGNDGAPLCFSVPMVMAERDVAEGLTQLATAAREQWTVPKLPSHLAELQVAAVEAVAQHGVVVLTGGPGTGKSTVVAQIIELAQANGCDLLLAAPTGRAAKRLEQATGEPAKTIHRLLEFQPETGGFNHGPADPLPPGLVVIDESSMVDVVLAQALLGALTDAHRLLLVGDADQLPSVGPGNVLRDIMTVAELPESPVSLVRLTQVFRQAEGSSIVTNAHRILAGEPTEPDPPGAGGQFFVVAASDANRAHQLIVKMAADRIPKVYGLDGRTDVQVLTPMHKGRVGTEALNLALQDEYTAGHSQVELRANRAGIKRSLRMGDRVMQTRNDYDKGVFNGDVGVVAVANPDEHLVKVDFDDQRVTYEGKDMFALQLAYAVSIHKSQGSEFEAVIVTLMGEHHVMLRRNLLYTAVTRARRLCVLVGDPRAIRRAIDRVDDNRRHTSLRRRLSESLQLVESDEANPFL